MKRNLIAMALAAPAFLLAGCSGAGSIDGGHEVDCTAYYTGGTFGLNQGAGYPVHIDRAKTDHNGTMLVRPESNLNIHFMGGYKKKSTFHHYQCKSGSIEGAAND